MWSALARLPFADRFEGARPVARRELVANLKSLRLVIIALLLLLSIVGGSAGISALVTSFAPREETNTVFFVHPLPDAGVNSTHTVVVFVSDAWGRPHSGFVVEVARLIGSQQGPGPPGPGSSRGELRVQPIANGSTDASGFVRISFSDPSVLVGYIQGNAFTPIATLDFQTPSSEPFSVVTHQFDLSQNGSRGDVILQAVDPSGAPLVGAQVLVGSNTVAALDAKGFAHLRLPPGDYNITVRAAAGEVTTYAPVSERTPTAFDQGADAVLFIVSVLFVPFIVPIATIAVAHDAIARERAQGSIDLILSRPSTRYGVLLGKFLGTTAALLIPVVGTMLLGALVISALTAHPVTLSFLGAILVALALYIAAYGLILLILSTLARSTGTAIMFGILLWVVYNILWGIVIFLIAAVAGLSIGDAGFYAFEAYVGLFNLNSIYTSAVGAALPSSGSSPFSAGGVEILPSWAPLAASVIWLIVLLAAALYIFDRKVAE